MAQPTLLWNADAPYAGLVGVGAIGTGLFFALEGGHTLGRNESRPARLLDVRDYCKLHIIAHYVAVLLGASRDHRGFHVMPVAKVGEDSAGRSMLDEMIRAGMDIRGVWTVKDRPTTLSVCFQYPDGSGGNITTSDSAAAALAAPDVDSALAFLRAPGNRYMALAAPEVPIQVRQHLLRRASQLGAFRVACLTSADAVSEERHALLELADLVAMNEDEASTLTGLPFPADDPRPFLNHCAALLQSYHSQVRILMSAGSLGAFAFDGSGWVHHPALSVPVASSAGAGDALLAGVLSALAVGIPLTVPRPRPASARHHPLDSALDLGVILASFSVTSPHTIHPDARLETLLAFAQQHDLVTSKNSNWKHCPAKEGNRASQISSLSNGSSQRSTTTE
jgi:sugar/nucleoside kinase (ribokinase family)